MEAPELVLWRTFHLCQRRAPLSEIKRWSQLILSYFMAYQPKMSRECHTRLALCNVASAVFAAGKSAIAAPLPALCDVIEAFQSLKNLCEPNEDALFQDKELQLRIHVSIPF
jgi:hypothetical protein